MLTVTVAIPSFNRPDFLRRAMHSIYQQKYRPDELLVILRSTDHESHRIANHQINSANGLAVRVASVAEGGFLPPIYKAIELAKTDILVFMDDDAEAHEDWLEKLLKYYDDSSIAGVGGRYINYFSGEKALYSPVRDVGRLTWYGKPIGNMYRDTLFAGPREVDFLIGGNMSYRLVNLRQSPPDYALRQNVSFHWEMDIGLQLRNRGYRLLFDPALKVDHYSAPRQIDGLRTINIEGIFWSNFNYAYLMKKHLSGYRLTVYVLYSAMIGWSDSPGFVLIMLKLLQLKPISWSRVVWPSMRGRLGGLQQPVGVGSLDA